MNHNCQSVAILVNFTVLLTLSALSSRQRSHYQITLINYHLHCIQLKKSLLSLKETDTTRKSKLICRWNQAEIQKNDLEK